MYDYKMFIAHNEANKQKFPSDYRWRIEKADYPTDRVELKGGAQVRINRKVSDFESVIMGVMSGKIALTNPSVLQTWFEKSNSLTHLKKRVLPKIIAHIKDTRSDFENYMAVTLTALSKDYPIDLSIYRDSFYIGMNKIKIFCDTNCLPYRTQPLSLDERDKTCCALCDVLINDECEVSGVKETIAFLKEAGFTKRDCTTLNFDGREVADVYNN